MDVVVVAVAAAATDAGVDAVGTGPSDADDVAGIPMVKADGTGSRG